MHLFGWVRRPTLRSWTSLGAVALALLLVGADAVAAQAPVVRDSAGVRIVENDPSVLDGRAPWRIGPEPLLRIGEQDGAQAYLFHAVQGSTVLPDGTIAVTDGASYNVRLFDSSGAHLRTIGRLGQGPEEFPGRVSRVTHIEPDLLRAAYGQAAVFCTTGEFIRSFRCPSPEGHRSVGPTHGVFLRDGSSVVWSGESPWQRPIEGSWRRSERVELRALERR